MKSIMYQNTFEIVTDEQLLYWADKATKHMRKLHDVRVMESDYLNRDYHSPVLCNKFRQI